MVGATSRRDFPVLSAVNLLRIGWGFAEQLVVRQKKHNKLDKDSADGTHHVCSTATPYTQGEVTSQNLWPRYDRHFVGIIRRNVWSKAAKIYRVI